jgi:hypothetical protein
VIDDSSSVAVIILKMDSLQVEMNRLIEKLRQGLHWLNEHAVDYAAEELLLGRGMEREIRITENLFRHRCSLAIERLRGIPCAATLATLRSVIVLYSDQIRQRVELDIIAKYPRELPIDGSGA